jgi:hypothetical protein
MVPKTFNPRNQEFSKTCMSYIIDCRERKTWLTPYVDENIIQSVLKH